MSTVWSFGLKNFGNFTLTERELNKYLLMFDKFHDRLSKNDKARGQCPEDFEFKYKGEGWRGTLYSYYIKQKIQSF